MRLYVLHTQLKDPHSTTPSPPFMDTRPCLAILPPLLCSGSLITGSVLSLISSKPRLPLHPNPIIPAPCVTTPSEMIYQRIIGQKIWQTQTQMAM